MIAINRSKIKIIFVVCFILLLFSFGNTAFGQITDADEGISQSTIAGILATLSTVGLGALGMPITALILVLLLAVYAILTIIFGPMLGGLIPLPDDIVFNKIAFFDANVFNPVELNTAPAYIIKDIVSNLYGTAFIIAGVIFGISASVIGIKLAMTSIASEKAHYKQALNNWLVGIVLLFTTHFIIIGMFALNEQIVQVISDQSADVTFKITAEDILPGFLGGTVDVVGKTVGKIVNFFGGGDSADAWDGSLQLKGYSGMFYIYLLKAALKLDLVSAIVLAIILGQTIAIIVMYLKRFFYCILLIIIAPLIVATDVMKKTF